jgi:hypothetical protein
MKRVAFTFGIALALAFATSIPGAATSGSTTTTAPNDTPLIHVTLPSAGITLGYPTTWTATKYSGLPKAAQKKIATLNPKLAGQVQSAPPNSKLYAVDLTHPGSFSDNVNVIVDTTDGFPASLSDFRQGTASQYQSLGATLQSAAATSIGGKKGYTAVALLPLKVAADTTVNAYVTQVLVPKGDGGALVTITTTDDEAGHALAKRMAASIKLGH